MFVSSFPLQASRLSTSLDALAFSPTSVSRRHLSIVFLNSRPVVTGLRSTSPSDENGTDADADESGWREERAQSTLSSVKRLLLQDPSEKFAQDEHARRRGRLQQQVIQGQHLHKATAWFWSPFVANRIHANEATVFIPKCQKALQCMKRVLFVVPTSKDIKALVIYINIEVNSRSREPKWS